MESGVVVVLFIFLLWFVLLLEKWGMVPVFLFLGWIACGLVGLFIGSQWRQAAAGLLAGMVVPPVVLLAWQLWQG